MRADVAAFARFYGSPLGAAAGRLLSERISARWGEGAGRRILALGYPGPAAESLDGAVLWAADAEQGAHRWPAHGPGRALLAEETHLPFRDVTFDAALLVHALEEAASPRALLREVWRVLAPEGRVLIACARRTSLWALRDATPFGWGRPFSRGQLAHLLDDALFTPLAWSAALFAPPLGLGALVRRMELWERAGGFLTPGLSGVILVEAVKRIAASPPRGSAAAPAFVRALAGRPAPSRFNGPRLDAGDGARDPKTWRRNR